MSSPRKLDLPEDFDQDSADSTFNEIKIIDVSVGQLLTVTCKVVHLVEPSPVQSRFGNQPR